MNYEIVLAKTESDRADVAALDVLLDEEMKPFLPDFFDPGGSPRNYDDYLSGARGFALLAKADGASIGMARCGLGPFAVLESLVVGRAHRGMGVGSALLAAAREAARARGRTAMFLNVMNGNDAARRLYEREGFSDFRTTMISKL